MVCGYFIVVFYVAVIPVQSYSGLQTVITDVAVAKPLEGDNDFIWEPTPPSDGFYILGQYFSRQKKRPPRGTELIVGRSNNGSLAKPVDFYGRRKVKMNLFVWSMKCPGGYVSLGAIATHQETKPDVTKYRCVIKEQTMPAIMWGRLENNHHFSIRSIYSPNGWRNTFYVMEYKDQTRNTTAYTLRNEPLDLQSFIAQKNFKRKVQEEKVHQAKDVKSYTLLLVSGVFIVVVMIVFVVLFLKSTQTRHGNLSTISTKHTITTALSGGYNSDTDSNTSRSSEPTKKQSRFSSNSSRFSNQMQNDTKPEIRNNALYGLHKMSCESKPNILYHTIRNIDNRENEYEVINIDPACRVAEGRSPIKIIRSSGIYSFAT